MAFLPKTVYLCALAITLSACSGLSVEQVPLKTPPSISHDADPVPIGFNKIVYAIPSGTPLISNSPKGTLGLFFCDGPYALVTQTSMRGRGAASDTMREIFVSTLETMGYDVTGNPGRLFDDSADQQRTQIAIGGRITDIKMDVCRRKNFWSIPTGETGESHIEVEWSAYDLINRRTVFKKTTKGYAKTETPNHDGIQLLFEEALASSIHNLGADDEFNDLVFYGKLPAQLPKSYEDPNEASGLLFDSNEEITLDTSRLSHISAAGRWNEIRDSVVLIQSAGHGSGFFITREGHILTNAHVVGNAERMRIVTSGKNDALVAEVLRLDRTRDVALLKLETIPQGMSIKPLPVDLKTPDVGEDVYAIGAPTRTRLQDTLTKGIISAHRKLPYARLPIIQADVVIQPGNSGGPLLDANGNVIGIAVSGYTDDNGSFSALNNFIPIASALKELGIETVMASTSENDAEFQPIGLVP